MLKHGGPNNVNARERLLVPVRGSYPIIIVHNVHLEYGCKRDKQTLSLARRQSGQTERAGR
jgi:hypothetical protein